MRFLGLKFGRQGEKKGSRNLKLEETSFMDVPLYIEYLGCTIVKNTISKKLTDSCSKADAGEELFCSLL